MSSDKEIVIPTSNSYVFKNEERYQDLPAGVYYPKIDSNGRKHLVKQSSRDHYVEDMPGNPEGKELSQQPTNGQQSQMWGAEEAVDEAQAYEDDISDDNRQFSFIDSSYFRMEKYHTGIQRIHEEINWFLNNEDFHDDHEIDYKRGFLAFSEPGTGKTRYFNHQAKKLIHSENAVIVRIENHDHLSAFQQMIDEFVRYLDSRLTIIMIEELADLLEYSDNKNVILNLLDNQQFSNNIMFWITTNFPERIPPNVVDRPSRIDALVNINVDGYTDEFVDAWHFHLFDKPFPEKHKGTSWFEKACDRLNVAYWKELFIFAYINDLEYDEAWAEIQERKEMIKNNFRINKNDVGF